MDKETIEQVNEILNKEIDPIFFAIARRIAPRIKEQHYLPWLLAYKMDVDGARVMNALPDPYWKAEMKEFEISDHFAEELGLDKDYVEGQIQDRYYSGDVMLDPDEGPIIVKSRGLWIDLQHSETWFHRNGPAYYRIIGLMMEDDYTPLMEEDTEQRIWQGKAAMVRIIPRYDSVKDNPELLPAENYKEILRTRRIISQNRCACRIRYPEIGRPENIMVCLCANKAADWAIKIGLGKEIPWEEAFEFVQEAGRKEPFVHMASFSDQLKNVGDILCNCPAQTCGVMRNTVTTGGEHKVWDYYAKSRFRAVIDAEKCINCGLCANKRCMFDAIKKKYIRSVGEEKYWVNEVTCMGCGCCVETCPKNAIIMKLVDPPEALKGQRKVADVNQQAVSRPIAEKPVEQNKPRGEYPYL